MIKTLRQKFQKAISIPIQIIPSTGSLNGRAIDTRSLSSAVVTGTATGTTENKLEDTGEFTEDADFYVGMVVYNTTDHTYAKVTGKDDDNTLSISADIMDTGDGYALYRESKELSFDTALALIEIGNITGVPTSVKVKVEEDDDPAFGGAAVAAGGAEVTVAADHSYTMEIERTKRYLRIVVTTAGGTTPTVECCGMFILWNAQIPNPRLSADDIDNA